MVITTFAARHQVTKSLLFASGLAAICTAISGLVGLVAQSTSAALVALAACAIAATLPLLTPRRAILVALLLLYFVPFQAVPGGLLQGIPTLKWMGLLIIPALALVFLIRRAPRSSGRGSPAMAALAIFFVVALWASWAVNGGTFLDIVGTGLLYLRYPVLFLVLVSVGLDRRSMLQVVGLFFGLTFLQLPETTWRYFVQGVTGDHISWSLGPWGHFPLGVYCIYAICIVVGMCRSGWIPQRWLLLLPLFVLPALMGEIKALLIGGPLCAIAIAAYPRSRDTHLLRRNAAVVLIALTGLGVSSSWGTLWQGSNNTLAIYAEQLQSAAGVGTADAAVASQGSRATITLSLIRTLAQDRSLWLGKGPGSSLAGGLSGRSGEMHTAAGMQSGYIQTAAVLWDVGLLGFVAYFGMLILGFAYVVMALRKLHSRFDLGLAFAAVGMWVFYALLGPWYDLVWRYDTASFLFWIVLAYLAFRVRVKQKMELPAARHEPQGRVAAFIGIRP